jgi:hypothetical protein
MNKTLRTFLLMLLLSVCAIHAVAIPAAATWTQLVNAPANLAINVSAYGVKGDGIADDTAAFQAAIDATPPGGIVQVPAAANIKLTRTIFVYGKNSITIEGSQGDSYGKTSPRLTWAGPEGGTMIRWLNNGATQISGFFFDMASSAIAIDVDMDGDRTVTCSAASGTKNLTCSNARFKTGTAGYNATDEGRTIVLGGTFTTTIAKVTSTTTATLAANVPSTLSSASSVIKSPYGSYASSSNRFERLTFSKVRSTASTVGLRMSYWSGNNNERHQIDRVSCFFGGNLATSTTAGTCFKIGDNTVGGGSNALNIIFTNPYWYGPSIGIDSQSASYTVLNGESNYATKDYNIVSGSARIIEHRTESQRQFLTAFGAHVTVDGAFIGYGAWNTAYPLIYADNGNILTLNDIRTSDQAGITGLDANAANPNQLVLSNPIFGASLKLNYQNFSQGVTCLMCAQRVGLYLGGADGVGSSIQMKGTIFNNLIYMFSNNLSTQGNGTMVFCQDCVLSSNPCKGGGTGAFAKRINGTWNCQ